jgi:hypothetical protein
MHRTLFNPPINTLVKAIENKQLEGFPFVKPTIVHRYLAPSPVISKGCMKRPIAGIRSTSKRKPEEETEETNEQQLPGPNNIPDDIAAQTSNVFWYAVLVDKVVGTLYIDVIWALPVRSLNG